MGCRPGAGGGQIVLIDRDRLDVKNLRRHVCGRDDLGRPVPVLPFRNSSTTCLLVEQE
jgi:hypothetical protein